MPEPFVSETRIELRARNWPLAARLPPDVPDSYTCRRMFRRYGYALICVFAPVVRSWTLDPGVQESDMIFSVCGLAALVKGTTWAMIRFPPRKG